MPANRFDALFIDFYGTIAAGDHEAVLGACRNIVETLSLPVPAEQLAITWGEEFFRTIDVCNHDGFRTLHQCEMSSLRRTLRQWGHDVEPGPLVEEIEAYWANPDVHADVFDLFRRLDLPVVCVSNADNAPLHSAIERLGLRFDAVITSEDARSYKPDEQIFRRALAAVGVEPARVVHVGDSRYSDVGGAGRLGITTAWLCRDRRIHDVGTAHPDHTISTLAEVPALLVG